MGLKKADKINSPDSMKEKKTSLSLWHIEKLKIWAKENGMTERGAMRYIIVQFFKNKQ